MSSRMKKEKLMEEKLQLTTTSPMILSLSPALHFALHWSPAQGQQSLPLPIIWVNEGEQQIITYVLCMRQIMALQSKNLPLFLPCETAAVCRFIFLNSCNSHFLVLIPNLFPLPENIKAQQISLSSYLHYVSNAHASRDRHLMQVLQQIISDHSILK